MSLKPPSTSPKLWLPYAELERIGVHFAEKIMEPLARDLGDLFGFRTPTITGAHRKLTARRMRSTLKSMRGYILAEQILEGTVTLNRGRYAVLEGQVRCLMEAQRQAHGSSGSLTPGDDAVLALLTHLRKQCTADPWTASLPGYAAAREVVDGLAQSVSNSPHRDNVDKAMSEWVQRPEARRVIQFPQRLIVGRIRWRVPKRLTHRAVHELTQEYRDYAAIFELQLARLIRISEANKGVLVDWGLPKKPTLAWLQQRAQNQSPLDVLAHGIDRDLRNRITHGIPTLASDGRTLQIHEGRTMTGEEFFIATRRLMGSLFAMYVFDNQLMYVRFHRGVEHLIHEMDRETRQATANAIEPKGLQ